MSKPLLSIIIPAFNAEEFIESTLDSCVENQCEELYEIIVINDGSIDGTDTIVEKYARTNKIIRYYVQNNKGQSAARNFGLEQCYGQYVWFVDSDDLVTNHTISYLIKTIQQNCFDILMIHTITDKEEFVNRNVSEQNANKLVRNPILNDRIINVAPWASIFNKQFLIDNRLRFSNGIYHEDLEFSTKAYYKANIIYKTNRICYVYRTNNCSTTNSVNFKKNFDLIEVSKNLSEYAISNNIKSKSFYNYIGIGLNISLNNWKYMPKSLKEEYLNRLNDNIVIFHKMIKSSKLKYIIEGLIGSIRPSLVAYMYSFIGIKAKVAH